MNDNKVLTLEEELQSTNSQIMKSINSLVSMENTEDDFNDYKIKTKQLLEQLLLKLEENVDYERSLEEQIDDLEEDLRSKDQQYLEMSELLEKHSVQSNQAYDELNERFVGDASARRALEVHACRLQRKLVRLENEVKHLRVATDGASMKSSGAHLADLHSENEDLRLRCRLAEEALQEAQFTHEQEMLAMYHASSEISEQIKSISSTMR